MSHTPPPPSFLTLPAEIRHKIFDVVFEIEPVHGSLKLTAEIELMIDMTRDAITQPLRLHMRPTYPSHPLLSVSRIIRSEARARFRFVLSVVRRKSLRYKWDGVAGVDGLGVGERFWYKYRDGDEGGVAWFSGSNRTGNATQVGLGVACDDFCGLMSGWMLGAVRVLRLESCVGLHGRRVNRGQFPGLERVDLIGFATVMGALWYEGETRRMGFERGVMGDGVGSIRTGETGSAGGEEDVIACWRGDFDKDIRREVGAMFRRTIRDVGSREERGFDIRFVVRYCLLCSTHSRLLTRGYMDIIVDYDTDYIVSRSNPCVAEQERLQYPKSYDMKLWTLVEDDYLPR